MCRLYVTYAFVVVVSSLPAVVRAQVITQPEPMPTPVQTTRGELVIKPAATSSADDFDFLTGSWIIHNRKLKARLASSTGWDTFEATGTLRKVLHGQANIDNFVTAFDGKPFEGMTLRLFDPHTRLWSIYWSDANRGTLDKPVVGSFDGDIGSFYCRDTYEGKDIVVKFQWDKTDPAKPVWSQAFSADSGKSWEWNWYMYFERPAAHSTFSEPIRVLELRNYLLKPNTTARFTRYFSDHFVGSQQAQGAMLPGTFTVQGQPDRFFWMRGFTDMAARFTFLQRFYGGPVWKGYGRDANAMMIDSDQVHLLRPWPEPRIDNVLGDPRYTRVVIDYHTAQPGQRDALLKTLKQSYIPKMKERGVPVSLWVTEMQENDFKRLPVIQEKELVVVISLFEGEADYAGQLGEPPAEGSGVERIILNREQ